MAKGSANQVDEAVLSYLKGANRPYSVNDVVNNLQGKFTKSVITKSIEGLVEVGDVVEKINGKQKYYFYSQDRIILDQEKLREVEENIKNAEKEMAELRAEIASQGQKLELLKKHVPLETLEKELRDQENICNEMQKKAEEVTEKCKNIDPEAQIKAKKKLEVYVKEWKRRKRLATEMFGQIHENISKPKKALLEEIGIETDEDNDAKMPL